MVSYQVPKALFVVLILLLITAVLFIVSGPRDDREFPSAILTAGEVEIPKPKAIP